MEESVRKECLKLLDRYWTPHTGQKEVLHRLFDTPADMVYVECGRKFGKTDLAVYSCWRMALTHDNAEIHYLAPLVKQAKKLVWFNYRMQSCNSQKEDFIKELEAIMGGKIKLYNSEGRVVLPNGSYIIVDGSDNIESQRGQKPHFIAADEYRDSHPGWLEAVRPNMSVNKAKILFVTTPPHLPNHAYDMAVECKEGMEKDDPHYYYLNMPSYTNDRISDHKNWLEREKERLYRVGRRNEWHREYMAEFIPESERAVIPQLNRELIKDTNDVLSDVLADGELYLALDPYNSSVFAALLAVYDPYKGRLYLLDVIREVDSSKASAASVWPRMKELETAGYSIDDATIIYNQKTPWLRRDLQELCDISAIPSSGDNSDQSNNISLIKDMIMAGDLVVSSNCHPLVLESERYQSVGEEGRIPRIESRPLLNCLRFIVSACGYSLETLDREPEPSQDLLDLMDRSVSADEAVADKFLELYGVEPEFYDDSF